jgi:hypothetical protein
MKMSGAIAISSIAGAGATDDGEAMLLVATISTGADVILSIPQDQLLTILAITAAARTECRRRMGLVATETEEMLVVQQFAIGRDSGTHTPVLTLTLANAARLVFKLSDETLAAMLVALQAMHGVEAPLTRGLV